MCVRPAVLALCVASLASGGAALTALEEKERPVSKVIGLLKDMLVQMEKEAEEDQDIYETMGCWCETNDKAKTQSIADAKSKIDSLTATIEETAASSARLTTEIANLKKEVGKNQQALDTAKGIRAKSNMEFNAVEKDMLQSIGSMKGAIVALSKHNKGASLLQVSVGEATTLMTSAKSTIWRHLELVSEIITPRERAELKAFLQSRTAGPSGEIFGMMEAMKESFEVNLATAQKTEAAQAAAFSELDAAKSAEIAAGQDQADAKTNELAAAGTKNAASKQDLEDTELALDADTKFLATLKETCTNLDQEFEERSKTRSLEMAAVSKALQFLSSDEAHALFSSTFSASFLQAQAQRRSESKRRAAVVRTLQAASLRSRDPRLSALYVRARSDQFASLKKTIKTMVDRLNKEKKDEFKHRDFCIEQLQKNEKDTASSTMDKEDTDAKIAALQVALDNLTKEIDGLKADVAELSKQLKEAGEDREKANKDFAVTVADQRATQKLLTTALGVLKGFYEKGALVQTSTRALEHDAQAPPVAFKSYSKSKSSGGVMGMMQGIIDDAKALEAEAIRAEEDSQKDYELFVQDTNDSIGAKKKAITEKSQVRAKTDANKLDEEVKLDQIMMSLEQLGTELADVHRSCDYLLKNFEVRTAARDAEIEALNQAIAMFSGAKFSAFIQHY